jgi:hypothetical protein
MAEVHGGDLLYRFRGAEPGKRLYSLTLWWLFLGQVKKYLALTLLNVFGKHRVPSNGKPCCPTYCKTRCHASPGLLCVVLSFESFMN